MLAKQYRFSFKNRLPRNTIQSRSFSLRFERNDIAKLQVAVVVSKKVDKRAVVRNRIERLILEIIRKNLALDTNLSIVFYAKKEANEEGSNIVQEVTEALNKITK